MHDEVHTPGETALAGPVRPVRLAPLKDGLPAEKRAFAEDFRQVFLTLGISVRRYAARRYLNPSSVTRYLSGERIPPWDFVAGVIDDVRKVQAPLTFKAEAALQELHQAALKTNRHGSEVQALQDKLAEADEETRRITTRRRALEEALLDREGRLATAQDRCRRLVMQLEEQRLSYRAEVEVWHGEYEELQEECDELHEECGDLQEQVNYLRESLAVTRAELIAAEDRCHRLEMRLDTLQELGAPENEDGSPGIMAMLEEADRRSSVPELVQAVGDLEQRTRQATARELVRAASQSRTIEEVADLLASLRQEGFDSHAQAALPALVMMRSVDETSALVCELFHKGIEDYVLSLIQTSVTFHQPEHVVAFGAALHHAGLPQYAETLLQAMAVTCAVSDLVSAAHILADGATGYLAAAAISAAAARRPVADLATLTFALRQACLDRFADAVQTSVADERPASDVAKFIRFLREHGLKGNAEAVLHRTQERSVGHLVPLIEALDHGLEQTVLAHAARSRPVSDIAVIISESHVTGSHQFATDLLTATLCTRSNAQVREMFQTLDCFTTGSEALTRAAARILTPEDTAGLVVRLEDAGLPRHAEAIFRCTVHDEFIGHAGRFLAALDETGSRYARQDVLRRHARGMRTSTLAALLLALDSASLFERVDAVARDKCVAGTVHDIALLAQRLDLADVRPRGTDLVRRLLGHVLRERPLADQAAFVSALRSVELAGYAQQFAAEALKTHGRPFAAQLGREQTKHEQKVMSREFWRPYRRDGRPSRIGKS